MQGSVNIVSKSSIAQIRMALVPTGGHIRRMVVWQGMRLAIAGVLLTHRRFRNPGVRGTVQPSC